MGVATKGFLGEAHSSVSVGCAGGRQVARLRVIRRVGACRLRCAFLSAPNRIENHPATEASRPNGMFAMG